MTQLYHRISKLVIGMSWIVDSNVHVARMKAEKALPVKNFVLANWTDHFTSRLALLEEAEWQRLGFAVACLPYAGHLKSHLNGKLRKAVTLMLSVEQIDALDKMAPVGESQLAMKDWEHAEAVSMAGKEAVIVWLCDQAHDDLKLYLQALHQEQVPVAMTGMTEQIMEDLCKIILPELPWLWSSEIQAV